MASGIYYAFKRKKELDLTTTFTYLLQLWLSIFGFSIVAIGIIGNAIGGLLKMENLPQYTFTFSFAVLVIFLIVFIIITIYVSIKLIQLFWNGLMGQTIKYNPLSTPDNILKAIKPINDKENLHEYKQMLHKLIKENKQLMAEYENVIRKLEAEDGDKSKPNESKPN
jgi:hypothetical protein